MEKTKEETKGETKSVLDQITDEMGEILEEADIRDIGNKWFPASKIREAPGVCGMELVAVVRCAICLTKENALLRAIIRKMEGN